MTTKHEKLFEDLYDMFVYYGYKYGKNESISKHQLLIPKIYNTITKIYERPRYYKIKLDTIYFLGQLFINLKDFYPYFKNILWINKNIRHNIKMVKKIDLLLEFIFSLKVRILFKDSIEKFIADNKDKAQILYTNIFKVMFNDPYINIKNISDCLSQVEFETTVGAFINSLLFENHLNNIKDEHDNIIFDIRSKEKCNFMKIKSIEKVDKNILKYFNNIHRMTEETMSEFRNVVLKQRMKNKHKNMLIYMGIGDTVCDEILDNYELDDLNIFNSYEILMDFCVNNRDIYKINDRFAFKELKDRLDITGDIGLSLIEEDQEEEICSMQGEVIYPFSILETLESYFYINSGIFSAINKKPYVLSSKNDINIQTELEEKGIVFLKG